MLLLRVVDKTVIVYVTGLVIALSMFAFFSLIGVWYAMGTQNLPAEAALFWAMGGLAQLVCPFAYLAATGYWWRYVVRKLDIQGFGPRGGAVVVGSLVMSGLLLATAELSRLFLAYFLWTPAFSQLNLFLFAILAGVLIFAGRWQLRYNFHSGYSARIMDYWLFTPDERERLQSDYE